MGTGQGVGQQGRLHRLVLDRRRQEGERSLLARTRRQIAQAAPDLVLDRRRDLHAFGGDHVLHPLLGPGSIFGRIERGQGLEGEVALVAAEDEELAAGQQGRGPRAGALVEIEDLRFGIAQPLHGDGVQEHRFARAGRSDDHGVAHVALVQVEAERSGAGGAGDHQRRLHPRMAALGAFGRQMRVARWSRPDRRHRDHVAEVQRGHERAAQIGIGLTRQAAEPSLHGVDVLDLADEPHPVDGAFDLADPVGQPIRVAVHQGDRRREIADRGIIAAKDG